MKKFRTAAAVSAALSTVVAVLIGCSEPPQKSEATITDTGSAAAGEWVLHGRDFGEQRHAALSRINTGNVARLGLAFTYDGITMRGRTRRGTQATPLMQDGVLYFTGPWSVVYAVDARTGQELWVHDPEVDGQRARVTCCDAVNRGVALRGDRVYVATLDGYLLALDKRSGRELWRTDTLIDRNAGYTITGAPRFAGDLLVIGNGGGEMGVRGYVSAYKPDGSLAWRFFTVPSAGEPETEDVALAKTTWSDTTDWSFGGGGTAWDSFAYDPQSGLLYIGVGNGSPWPNFMRNGSRDNLPDNLYLSSIVAVEAQTGKRVWHYQTTPADTFDYTASQHMILADLQWQGETRQVLMQAPKNGFFYVLDRITGELLAADNYVPVNWAEKIDLKTGRPVLTEHFDYSGGKKTLAVPTPGGGHNWHPMALHPEHGLVYIPTLEGGVTVTARFEDEPHVPFSRNSRGQIGFPNPKTDGALLKDAPPLRPQSVLKAWDPQSGRAVWQSDPTALWAGGVLSTAGDLVFQGTAEGVFLAYHAKTGEVLKRIDTGVAIAAPPMTYELDGVQYVAVLGSMGGVMKQIYFPGFAPLKHENKETLFVFKLDGGPVTKPPLRAQAEMHAAPTDLPKDAAVLARGGKLYRQLCSACHAYGGAPNGYPNLWNMPEETYAAFDEIVLNGAYAYAGMPGYGDILSAADARAVKAYLADSHHKLKAAKR